MTTGKNRKKVLIPHTMGQEGKAVLLARDDIDTVVALQVIPARQPVEK